MCETCISCAFFKFRINQLWNLHSLFLIMPKLELVYIIAILSNSSSSDPPNVNSILVQRLVVCVRMYKSNLTHDKKDILFS